MRKLYQIHRIMGVSIGVVLALLSLAGSLLVFLPDVIDPWLNADLLSVEPAATRITVQEVLERASQAFPQLRPAAIVFPRHAKGTYEVWMMVQEPAPVGKSQLTYVDPYRGTLLGSRVDGESLRWWVFYLHVFLFDLSGSGGSARPLWAWRGSYWWGCCSRAPGSGTAHAGFFDRAEGSVLPRSIVSSA